jgi:hypothetical protein
MLHRQEANSRFLTDCYLFLAAVRSGACPKLGEAELHTRPEYEPALPAESAGCALFNGKSLKNKELLSAEHAGRQSGPTLIASVGLPSRQFACRRKKAGMSS